MDEAKRWRALQVPEDAAEGCVLMVPVPPEDWYCYSEVCGRTKNSGEWLNCQFCGLAREEQE